MPFDALIQHAQANPYKKKPKNLMNIATKGKAKKGALAKKGLQKLNMKMGPEIRDAGKAIAASAAAKKPRKARKPRGKMQGPRMITKAQLVKKASNYNKGVMIKTPSKMKKAQLMSTLRAVGAM